MENEAQSMQQLFFDPNEYPQDTLKAFVEFTKKFQLGYDAKYPDPPNVSMDAALERWKFEHTTTDVPQPRPTLQDYDEIRENWRQKDKVVKFLGFFSSSRFYEDWLIACPNEKTRSATFSQHLSQLCRIFTNQLKT